MWILDCYSRGNRVELWLKNGKKVKRNTVRWENSFYLYLPDPSLHSEMISALESFYRIEECEIKTIYGKLKGYKIYAGRDVAEKVERQAKDCKLFNVDVRLEQKFMAEKGIFPCSKPFDIRFSSEFEVPLTSLSIELEGNIFEQRIEEVYIDGEKIVGKESEIVEEMLSKVESADPDLILFRNVDFWMHRIEEVVKRIGAPNSFSRTSKFIKMPQKSYWSYGRAKFRREALIPEGRILIDTENFNYREGGLKGVLLASRISAISANLASRLSPGTLISLYEVYEALKIGIAVPFRKSDAEKRKTLEELRQVDKGGMILQPSPGIYEDVWQLDFTSMYPSIIVQYNLSPETVRSGSETTGFLPKVLKPLLELRIRTKRLKKENKEYSGIDSMLKWMLVTCFGYTGYRNAKFGRIEVHEEINRIGREIFLKTKEIAENMGFEVIHGLVDCVWLKGYEIEGLRNRVELETGLLTEVDKFSWIVFLPMKDGSGAYNRYYGRLFDGKMKLRGVFARRRDCPEYVKRMQLKCFDLLSKAEKVEDLIKLAPKLRMIYEEFAKNMVNADPEELIIKRIVSRSEHAKETLEASAVREYRRLGFEVLPGMALEFVVVDRRKKVVKVRNFDSFDVKYYLRLLRKAWEEIEFAIKWTTNAGGGIRTRGPLRDRVLRIS
ncbi:MAG: polymerase, archaea type [Archaeoglobaceae archaeon]|nr:polymerase, archaea type [Archaeoglobaceae archaeon]